MIDTIKSSNLNSKKTPFESFLNPSKDLLN